MLSRVIIVADKVSVHHRSVQQPHVPVGSDVLCRRSDVGCLLSPTASGVPN